MLENRLHDATTVARVLRVAWMGIVLGLVLELIFLLIQALTAQLPPLIVASADTIQKLSWSSLVCAGLALGSTLSKHLKWGLGISGLIVAPIAFTLSRSLHKALKEALGAPAGPATPDFEIAMQALLKAAEYAALGLTIAKLDERTWTRARHYVFAGIGIGAPFACIAIFMSAALTASQIVLRIVGELLTPAGCALVLYAGQIVGRHLGNKTSNESIPDN